MINAGSNVGGFDKTLFKNILIESSDSEVKTSSTSISQLAFKALDKTQHAKAFLILGQSKTTLRYKDELEALAKRNGIVVLSLNWHSHFDQNLVDFIVNCDLARAQHDAEFIDFSINSYWSPFSPEVSIIAGSTENITTVKVEIKTDTLVFSDDTAYLPYRLSLSLALSLLSGLDEPMVYLAGVDGYEHGDPKNIQIAKCFDLFQNSGGKLIGLTPNMFNLPIVNLFELIDEDEQK